MAKQDKTIVRVVKRENPFVQIDKTPINDPNLSWKAKGLLVYLISKPDDWTIMICDLIKHAKDGRDSVYSGLKELEDTGYLSRQRIRNENGTFERMEYCVYEIPQTLDTQGIEPQTENPYMDETATNGKSVYGKSRYGKSRYGKTDTTNNKSTNNDLTKNKETKNKVSQSVNSLPKTIATTIEKNGLTDRLSPISKVYESVKDTTGYSDALFIQTLLKSATLKEASNQQKNNLAFERYIRKAILTNISEQHAAAVNGTGKKGGLIEDKLPASVQKQLERESKGVSTSDEKKKLKDYPELQNMLDKLREDQKEVI